MPIAPTRDQQTVTSDGRSVAAMIAGVKLREAVNQLDERGELCEILSAEWGFHPAAMVYCYMVTVRPGRVRGWVKHEKQDDRIFAMFGAMRWVLYDDRPDSPTYRRLQQFTCGERRRVLFTTPMGVWHAVQNVGTTDACFVNLPTQPYDYANPDKIRLPLVNDVIPFVFGGATGVPV